MDFSRRNKWIENDLSTRILGELLFGGVTFAGQAVVLSTHGFDLGPLTWEASLLTYLLGWTLTCLGTLVFLSLIVPWIGPGTFSDLPSREGQSPKKRYEHFLAPVILLYFLAMSLTGILSFHDFELGDFQWQNAGWMSYTGCWVLFIFVFSILLAPLSEGEEGVKESSQKNEIQP